ncbi:hypothetical protein AHAT_09610 [Agarivorans sp. Toyoura001]|uniref:hypothetical protein n=1 Tax=Agarivorans sp. Toyoura001 TaxID=2283141 RepID=UPI0010E9CCC3|nr:hypothetical protein [Agarivorans sp. Toyoura001]GDY25071.1 hypothetical protein AHAT_09610 [Agarivorans sp. Toyoura001]
MKKLVVTFGISVILLFANFASATIISDDIYLSCSQDSGSASALCEGKGAMAATVSDEVEFADYFNFDNSLSIDVLADSIFVSFDNGPYCGWFTCSGQGFLSFVLSDLDWIGMPNAALNGIDVITNMSGVQTGFTADSVSFALPETTVNSSMYLQIDLLTNSVQNKPSVSVTEPASAGVFALVVFGLAARRIKQQKLRTNTQ